MELDCDKHVCLQCGSSIIGLDNYISHRQQKCFKMAEELDSPLLSEGCEHLTSVDSTAKEELQDSTFATSDLDKLSADDFFLSLNLQNIANIGTTSQRSLNSVSSDSFSAKFCFTSFENDLDPTFAVDKEFLSDTIISDTTTINLENFIDPNHTNDCQSSFSFDLSCNTLFDKNAKKVKHQTEVSSLQNTRTSLRQANNKTTSTSCCEPVTKLIRCPYCEFCCAFVSTLQNHLLVCKTKPSSGNKPVEKIKQNLKYAKKSHFNCNICSFHTGDDSVFLEHLKHKIHRQKSAILKNPLICLPCGIECSGSDDMKTHFSKNHLPDIVDLHPVIVSERKKKLHCCYCLGIIHSCHYFILNNNSNIEFPLEDIEFIKKTANIVYQCSYGVEKTFIDSYINLLNSLLNVTHFENISDDNKILKRRKCIKTVSNLKSTFHKLVKNPKKQINTHSKRKRLVGKVVQIDNSPDECNTSRENNTVLINEDETNINPAKEIINNKMPFLCEICGYSTKIFHHLTKHKRYHTGEKPFKCKECGVSFAVCSQLLRHKRLHTGAKPYKCPYCAYVCNTQENLRKHILKTKKHAGKKMYPCKHCKFECNDFTDYKNHLLQEHSENYPDDKSINSSAVAGIYEMAKT